MNTYSITKAMIESAVDHGIRSMEEDPGRSIRRLCDLGKQFSKNRFQNDVFDVMQEVLSNENSSYYDLVDNTLRNVDHSAIRIFGMGFGYSSWVYGGRIIRRLEQAEGIALPLTPILRYQPGLSDGTSPEDIARLIHDGMELGIYSWFIREVGPAAESYELIDIFRSYPDCSFVYLRPTGRLTAAQVQMLRQCRNLMVALPSTDLETALTALLLRDQKILFSISSPYGKNTGRLDFETSMRHVIGTEAPIFLPVAEDGTPQEDIDASEKLCYQSRLDQKYPTCIIDFYGDTAGLTNRIAGHRELLEISEDRRVLRPFAAAGRRFPLELPLLEALRQVMPALDASLLTEA
ncbi:hypothetical protein [Lachnoclostridium sp. Marseille-P6806]|uniref:hypothetical protein n=1 Tax=Lachnoclostridium sp. Marseille-P6806 TaxID=2364793 RepID=UPI001031A568|nr:hypothetical protein [Lachnoclostridium sp. Marseille-P6806]